LPKDIFGPKEAQPEPYGSYLNKAAVPVFQGKRRVKRTLRGNVSPSRKVEEEERLVV